MLAYIIYLVSIRTQLLFFIVSNKNITKILNIYALFLNI